MEVNPSFPAKTFPEFIAFAKAPRFGISGSPRRALAFLPLPLERRFMVCSNARN
jgi:hypothetical protein